MKFEIPIIPLISICTGSGLNQKYTDPVGSMQVVHCPESRSVRSWTVD